MNDKYGPARRATRESEPETEHPDGMTAAAKLLAAHPEWSLSRVAEAAGVSRTTIYAWRRDPRLIELVEALKDEPEVGIDPMAAIDEMDDAALESLEVLLENDASTSGQIELGFLIAQLSRRIEELDPRTWSNAVAELRKVTVRIARMDPGRDMPGFDDLGNPEPIGIADLTFAAQFSESLVATAKLIPSLLTAEQVDRVNLHARLSRLCMLQAVMLRHGLPIPPLQGDGDGN